MDVGIRDLRNNLSRYMERVRAGDEIVVTDRGAAIARVVPIDGERVIDRLIREGKVAPAGRARRSALPERARAAGQVSDLVAEQRR